MIDVTGMCKSFGSNTVLNKISFSLPRNACACFIGRNGCGKSTLLKLLSGMDKADSGKIEIGGTVGFAPQTDVLFDELSVNDNLRFWAAAANVKKRDIWNNECVKILNLAEMAGAKVKNLSGGMKRRVSIAVSVISNPEIVILDEPFTALDAFYKTGLTKYLKRIKQMGKTIIYTSHSAGEALGEMCDKIFLIENGKINYSGTGGDVSRLFVEMTRESVRL